jgi:hypothetical protein
MRRWVRRSSRILARLTVQRRGLLDVVGFVSTWIDPVEWEAIQVL